MTLAKDIRDRHYGSTIVHAHGCFDLLHPGHITLLKEAKEAGDILVVSVTDDKHVNKGSNRPLMTLKERMNVLTALRVVDYVIPSYAEDCEAILADLKPDVYVKGDDYDMYSLLPGEQKFMRNGTQFLQVPRTRDSTTGILGRLKSTRTPVVQEWMDAFKKQHSLAEIEDKLSELSETQILVIGEQIKDVYTYVEPLAKSPREYFMSSRAIHTETHQGGAKAVIRHLKPWVSQESMLVTNKIEIMKQRFIHIGSGTKLFGVQALPEQILTDEERVRLISHLDDLATESGCVLAMDYGHGFFDDNMRQALLFSGTFLAVNSQTNSANYGYNLATKWPRADYACLDGPEYTLALANGWKSISVNQLMLTKGAAGCYIGMDIPSFVEDYVDGVGAGDALFAFSAPLLALKAAPEVAGFVGSCAAAIQCNIMGNSKPISPESLWSFIEELMA